jgi:hypothetical protein
MPFESLWVRIPLAARWGISLLIGVAIVVALVIFVTHNDGNGLAHESAKGVAREQRQAEILIGQDQAPHLVTIHGRGASAATAALVAGIRREMRHQIALGNYDGPLQSIRCVPHGGGGGRLGYHCLAEAASVRYPFLAIVTPRTHRAAFCKKDYAPQHGQNIPVSAACRL